MSSLNSDLLVVIDLGLWVGHLTRQKGRVLVDLRSVKVRRKDYIHTSSIR